MITDNPYIFVLKIEVKMALFMDKSEALLLKTSMESDEDDYSSVNFRILEIEFFESDGRSFST